MIGNILTRKVSQNVVVFTTHKAGSMLLHGVLRDVCQAERIEYFSPNGTGSHKFPYQDVFDGSDFIAGRNGCFGALRFFVPSSALGESSIVLHLRDPRDVLTSMFFSYCFMHPAKYPGEVEPNTGHRRAVADAGIDRFVLDMSDENYSEIRGDYGTGCNFGPNIGNVLERYETYLREIVSRPGATLVSYEEMVLAFPDWLEKLIGGFPLKKPERVYRLILEKYAESVRPSSDEDVKSHKRKVTPGDHKEKLKPGTIAELNRRFAGVLDALGYSDPEYDRTGVPRAALV